MKRHTATTSTSTTIAAASPVRGGADSRGRWLAAVLVAAWVALAVASPARADGVKLGSLWYDGVTILDEIDGELVYTNPAGLELRQPLARVDGVRVDAFPQVDKAAIAMDKGEAAEAVRLLSDINNAPDWLEAYIGSRLVVAASEAGRPSDAVNAYLKLVKDDANPVYLEDAPLAVLAKADARDKARLGPRINDALKALTDEHAAFEALTQMAKLAGGDMKLAERVEEDAAISPESRVPMPSRIPEEDEAAQLLRKGKYVEARDMVLDILSKDRSSLARRMYVLGMAQLKIADEAAAAEQPNITDVERQYKDAGLTLLRVIVHFPRSDYTGAALMEVGYVHAKIGIKDKAAELYDEARNTIDARRDKHLIARLDTLRSQLAGDKPTD